MVRKGMALVVAVGICLIPLVGAAQNYADGHLAGQEAGSEDCDETDHFLRGVVGGVIYIAYVVIDPPNSPPDSRISSISGTSSDYQEGYFAGYEKAWQSCRLRNALFGASSWLFFYLILAALV